MENINIRGEINNIEKVKEIMEIKPDSFNQYI